MKNVGETFTAMMVDESTFFKLSDVNLKDHMNLIEALVEQGVVSTHRVHDEIQIDLLTLLRIRKALRLHQDLEINASGIAVIFDLLDQLQSMQRQLELIKIQIK